MAILKGSQLPTAFSACHLTVLRSLNPFVPRFLLLIDKGVMRKAKTLSVNITAGANVNYGAGLNRTNFAPFTSAETATHSHVANPLRRCCP